MWRRYLRLLGSDPAADVEDELSFHLDMRTRDLVRRGAAESEARAQARREFGDFETIRGEMNEIGRRRQRREKRASWTEALGHDVAYAFRTLRKSPAFTVVAVLVLALGIGSSSAMFTLVNSVLLRPLAYADPDRLVGVWEWPPDGSDRNVVSPANFLAWRDQAKSFRGLAASFDRPLSLTGGGEPTEVQTRVTTGDYFSVLGAKARLGRTYVDGEDAADVVVLSDHLWRRRFGGDGGVLGRTIDVNGRSRVVVGVMGADYRPIGASPDLWLATDLARDDRGRYLQVVGRLAPGGTVEGARSEMRTIAARLAAEYPEFNARWSAVVMPLREQETGEARPALLVLLGSVGLLLLISCANVANLMLARAAARTREMGVRVSLGATRARLVRQLLVESVVLASVGGAFGLALAAAGTKLMVRLLPGDTVLPRLDEVSVDLRVVAFAAAAALLAGLVFGLWPALTAFRGSPARVLSDESRGTTAGRERARTRAALIVAEIALALVLLAGAGLLLRSLRNLASVDLGINPRDALTMRLAASPKYQDEALLRTFESRLLTRLGALPGALAVGTIGYLPLSGEKSSTSFKRDDRPAPKPGEERAADIRIVGGDYFRAMGVPLRRGRRFDERDGEHAPSVFIINEAMARKMFPGEDPIGKQISFSWYEQEPGEIVGIVGDERESGPTEDPAMAIYRPFAQMPFGMININVVIRDGADPGRLARPAVAAIHEIDPAQPVAEVQPLAQLAADVTARARLNLFVLAALASLSLLLAGVGLYGVIAYGVAQRRHELGVRVALGAGRGEVTRLVVGQGIRLALLGVAVGGLGALFLTRLMRSLLFHITPSDPLTLAVVSAFLVLVALLASWLPARSASRIDPVVAMRGD